MPLLDREDLHLAAHKHLQAHLYRVLYRHVLTPLLTDASSVLNELARARVLASATFGAHALVTASAVPPTTLVLDQPWIFYIHHLLGLAQPAFRTERLARCHSNCPELTFTNPAVAPHALAYATPHAYHQLGCRCGPWRIRRHNRWAHGHADIITALAPDYEADLKRHLHSSATSKRQIDLRIRSVSRTPVEAIFDFTISVSFLPGYLHDAARDAHRLFMARARDKYAHHAADAHDAKLYILAVVGNTLGGFGPDGYVSFLRRLASSAIGEEIARGGSGREAAYTLAHGLEELQAVMLRSNYEMVLDLTTDP